MMTRDVLLEMEQEEDDDEEGASLGIRVTPGKLASQPFPLPK